MRARTSGRSERSLMRRQLSAVTFSERLRRSLAVVGDVLPTAEQTVMMSEVTGRRVRLASPATAVGLAFGIVVLGVVDLLLSARTHQLAPSTAIAAGLFVVTVGVGLVIAFRQPRNVMGWFLLGVAFLAALSNAASTYSVLDYRMRNGGLPLGALAVVVQPAWAPTIVLFGFALLIFPDGVIPPGRSRWVLAIVAALSALWIVGALGIAITAIAQHNIHVDSGGNLLTIDHPRRAWAWWGIVQDVIFPAFAASLALWAIQQVPKYRRSTGDRRLQLKWLYGGAVVSICCASADAVSSGAGTTSVGYVVGIVLFMGLAALPISMGVAILKFRLYDIDRLISRTLAYAVVTGLVVGVYVGIITLVTRVLGFSSPVAVAASTLAAVALFNPLRVRAQRVVDRRFNRARYDAEATVASFVTRLRDAVDLETVRNELLEVVNRAVEPAHASVWIRRRE